MIDNIASRELGVTALAGSSAATGADGGDRMGFIYRGVDGRGYVGRVRCIGVRDKRDGLGVRPGSTCGRVKPLAYGQRKLLTATARCVPGPNGTTGI